MVVGVMVLIGVVVCMRRRVLGMDRAALVRPENHTSTVIFYYHTYGAGWVITKCDYYIVVKTYPSIDPIVAPRYN